MRCERCKFRSKRQLCFFRRLFRQYKEHRIDYLLHKIDELEECKSLFLNTKSKKYQRPADGVRTKNLLLCANVHLLFVSYVAGRGHV